MILPILFWLPIFVLTIVSVEGTNKVASAWLPGWHTIGTHALPPKDVSWSKYTHMTFAFAETTPSVHSLTLNGSNPAMLPQFVSAAKSNGVKPLASIGGWTGSLYFSANVGSAANRTAFVNTVVNFAKQYKLDGLDFDWEYPTSSGVGCNTKSNNDTANFLSFLQELRKDSFDGLTPLTNVSAFTDVVDWLAIMNYDDWGDWSASVGPNSPLNDSCAATANQAGSALSAAKAWIAAGAPANQILLGVPAYGHSFAVNKTEAYYPGTTNLQPYPKFNSSVHQKGDAWDNNTLLDVCGNLQPNSSTYTLWGAIAAGFLEQDGTNAKGMPYRFDNCSQTPFVYNPKTEIMLSYDNAQSFKAKGEFITHLGLGGFAMWEAGGDSKNILLDAIRDGAGFGAEAATCSSLLTSMLPLDIGGSS